MTTEQRMEFIERVMASNGIEEYQTMVFPKYQTADGNIVNPIMARSVPRGSNFWGGDSNTIEVSA